MNLSQLQSLLALVETGSFTDAAEQVSLTQSAVSHGLATLERELGVTLLERSRRGVVAPTPVGQQVIPHVRALLGHAEAIIHEARAAQGNLTGKVRLGSIHTFVPPQVLGALLAQFQRQFPKIEVVLFDGALHEVGAWLDQHVVDVSFVILPAPGTVAMPITIDELYVLVPAGHRLSQREVVVAQELTNERFILEPTQCALHMLQQAGIVFGPNGPVKRYEARDSMTIFAMVREGLGITLLPGQMLPPRLEGLHALRLDPPHLLQIGLAYKERATLSRAAQLFLETATAWAQEHAPHVTSITAK